MPSLQWVLIALTASSCEAVERYAIQDSPSSFGATPMELKARYEQQKRNGLLPPGPENNVKPLTRKRRMTTSGSSESYSAALRSALLKNYDRNSFPWETHWASSTNTSSSRNLRTGLPVQLGINFHKVHEIDVTSSTADLVVWFRMSWTDPRLAWDPAEYGNLTSSWFWIEHGHGGNEASEIWTPDLYLWNQEEPIALTLDDSYAVVSPSGSIFWSRPGRIKATCKYDGLDKFPFDSLRCTMEFGSWSHSGLYIRPTKFGGTGYSIGGSETAGQSFAEFSLTSVVCEEFVYPPFPNDPEEDFPVLLYDVTVDRSSEPYIRGYVLVQVLLNLTSFCCFWIRPNVGERMGLAITSLLAAIASELTVAAKLPAASEINWFAVFAIVSMAFSVIVVFQSTVVLYFFQYTGGDLFPVYTPSWIIRWWKGQAQKATKAPQPSADTTMKVEKSDHDSTSSRGVDLKGQEQIDNIKPEVGGDASVIEGNLSLEENSDFSARVSKNRLGLQKLMQSTTSHLESQKLMNTTRRLSRFDAGDFRTDEENRNNVYWQRLSNRIDEYSRLIIPSAFVVFLSVVFAVAPTG